MDKLLKVEINPTLLCHGKILIINVFSLKKIFS